MSFFKIRMLHIAFFSSTLTKTLTLQIDTTQDLRQRFLESFLESRTGPDPLSPEHSVSRAKAARAKRSEKGYGKSQIEKVGRRKKNEWGWGERAIPFLSP